MRWDTVIKLSSDCDFDRANDSNPSNQPCTRTLLSQAKRHELYVLGGCEVNGCGAITTSHTRINDV